MSLKKIVKKCMRMMFTELAKRQVHSMGNRVCVNFPCVFTKNTIIGNNCHFNGMRISGFGKVVFGDNFHSGKDCRIITSNHNYDHGSKIPYDDTYVSKDVIIEDNVWLGERVIILSGVTIGEGAIIQAGSVVCKSIPPLSIAGGHPANPFKYRNENHYRSLKSEGSFF